MPPSVIANGRWYRTIIRNMRGSSEKTLMLGKIEGKRRRGQQRMRWMDGWMASPTWWTWIWVSSRSWWWTGKPSMLQAMGLQRVGHDWVAELNWWEFHWASLPSPDPWKEEGRAQPLKEWHSHKTWQRLVRTNGIQRWQKIQLPADFEPHMLIVIF